MSLRLKLLSKKFSFLHIPKENLIKAKDFDKNISFDNSFKSISYILKKIDDLEYIPDKKQLYFYYLSTYIDKINKRNKNIIFKEIGDIVKLTFPCVENIQNSLKISEANGYIEEKEIELNLILKKLNNSAILEYFIMENQNIPRCGIRKILNGYENICDFIIKNLILSENDLSNNDNTLKETNTHKEDINLKSNYNKINKNNKSYLTISDIVEMKQKISDHTFNNKLDNFIISKNTLKQKLNILKNSMQKCSDKIETMYLLKFLIEDHGYSIYFLLDVLRKINLYYSKDLTDDLFYFLELNILKFGLDFKINYNRYNYLYKNEETNIILGKQFDFCMNKKGIHLNDLFYKYENYQKDLLMEIKFKGKRTQIHLDEGKIKIFTEEIHQDNNEIIKKYSEKLENEIKLYNQRNPDFKINNFILDGIIVCYSNESKKVLDFNMVDKIFISNLDIENSNFENLNKHIHSSSENISEEEDFFNDFNVETDHMNLNTININSKKINNENKSYFLEGFKIMNDNYIIYYPLIEDSNQITKNEDEYIGIIKNENAIQDFDINNQDKNFINYDVENKLKEKKIFFKDLKENENKSPRVLYRFLAFDILHINDHNVFSLPLEKRKMLLNKYFSGAINEIAVIMGKTINLGAGGFAKNEIINYYNTAKEIGCNELVFKTMGYYTKYNFGNKFWMKVKFLYIF